MSMDLGILSMSEMVSGGYDHERWEAKPLQYYIKYCERVWSCERIVNACFGRSLRALQLRVAARVSHPTTAPMLHRVHYEKGDVSPWCAACCGTLRSGTLLAFSGGASGLMDVADTTTWQTSCACDKKSLICVKAF